MSNKMHNELLVSSFAEDFQKWIFTLCKFRTAYLIKIKYIPPRQLRIENVNSFDAVSMKIA